MLSIRDYAGVLKQKLSVKFYTSEISHNYDETCFEIEHKNEALVCSLYLDGRIQFKESFYGLHTKFESSINCPIDLIIKKLEDHFECAEHRRIQ